MVAERQFAVVDSVAAVDLFVVVVEHQSAVGFVAAAAAAGQFVADWIVDLFVVAAVAVERRPVAGLAVAVVVDLFAVVVVDLVVAQLHPERFFLQASSFLLSVAAVAADSVQSP